MTTDPDNVLVAVSGAVFRGLTSATAPTTPVGAPTGFTDLGYIGEDGVEITLPGEGDVTRFKAWGGGTVRVSREVSEDNPTWAFVMMETNLESVETYFGVEVTQTADFGSLAYKVSNRTASSYVVDAVDGSELIRDYIPKGVVTEVVAHKLSSGEVIGYGVTVEGELDGDLDYNFKRWMTSLASS